MPLVHNPEKDRTFRKTFVGVIFSSLSFYNLYEFYAVLPNTLKSKNFENCIFQSNINTLFVSSLYRIGK